MDKIEPSGRFITEISLLLRSLSPCLSGSMFTFLQWILELYSLPLNQT